MQNARCVAPTPLPRSASPFPPPMDATTFTVKRLFRDCLRLADYISTQVCVRVCAVPRGVRRESGRARARALGAAAGGPPPPLRFW